MSKCKDEWKTFVNSFGEIERYCYKTFDTYLSGHLYRGSAIETDHSCGNCDGARCYDCEEMYQVTLYDVPRETDNGSYVQKVLKWKRFMNEDDANKYYNSL